MIAPKTLEEKKIGNDCKYPEHTDGSSVLTKEKAYLKRSNGIFSSINPYYEKFSHVGDALCC